MGSLLPTKRLRHSAAVRHAHPASKLGEILPKALSTFSTPRCHEHPKRCPAERPEMPFNGQDMTSAELMHMAAGLEQQIYAMNDPHWIKTMEIFRQLLNRHLSRASGSRAQHWLRRYPEILREIILQANRGSAKLPATPTSTWVN